MDVQFYALYWSMPEKWVHQSEVYQVLTPPMNSLLTKEEKEWLRSFHGPKSNGALPGFTPPQLTPVATEGRGIRNNS